MSPAPANKNKPFLTVLFLAFGVGLAVAVALCAVWRYHPDAISAPVRVPAIAICPPFMLAGILEATSDNTLALIMTVGTSSSPTDPICRAGVIRVLPDDAVPAQKVELAFRVCGFGTMRMIKARRAQQLIAGTGSPGKDDHELFRVASESA